MLVSGSRYWHNYRHTSNTLVYYSALRRLGVPDESILLLLSGDSHACDARNAARCQVFSGGAAAGSVLPGGGGRAPPVEVDAAGTESTAAALVRALTGRLEPGAPARAALPGMDEGRGASLSLLLVLTGHGGEGFLKFHDKDELSYADLAGALVEAHALGRYGRVLIVSDTCQAASLGDALAAHRVPHAIALASSGVGQNAYATGLDEALAVSLADGFTRAAGGALLEAVAGKGAWRRAGRKAAGAAGGALGPSLGSACALAGNASAPACEYLRQWGAAPHLQEGVDALYFAASAAGEAEGGLAVRDLLRAQGSVDERSTIALMHTNALGEAADGGGEAPLLSFFSPN